MNKPRAGKKVLVVETTDQLDDAVRTIHGLDTHVRDLQRLEDQEIAKALAGIILKYRNRKQELEEEKHVLLKRSESFLRRNKQTFCGEGQTARRPSGELYWRESLAFVVKNRKRVIRYLENNRGKRFLRYVVEINKTMLRTHPRIAVRVPGGRLTESLFFYVKPRGAKEPIRLRLWSRKVKNTK